MATSLVGYRSFFNSTVYTLIEKMEKMEADPVFSLGREEAHTAGTGDTVNWTSEVLSTYLPIVQPGGDIAEEPVTEGNQLARTYFSIKGNMAVQYESYLHNKLDLMLDKAEDLAEGAMNTASLCLCGQLLTNADATTQTIGSVVQTISCADTLAPGSAAHTVPGRAGATFTTIVTSNPALSDTAVDTAMQILIANNVDQAGVNKPVGGDFVLVVAENSTMIKKAQQLTGSSLSPETANNAVNVYSGGKMDFVVLKHGARNAAGQYETTNTNQYHWLLSTKKSLKRNLRYRWAAKPSIPNQGLFPKYMEKNLDSRIYMFARLVYGLPYWAGMAWSFSTTRPTTS